MKLGLLNTTICTTDGIFEVQTISLEQAKEIAKINTDNFDSAVGHDSTAQIMSELLEVEIPVNRQLFLQQQGQTCLVFKLKGRPPEGVILTKEEIESIGYEFKLMTEISNSVSFGHM